MPMRGRTFVRRTAIGATIDAASLGAMAIEASASTPSHTWPTLIMPHVGRRSESGVGIAGANELVTAPNSTRRPIGWDSISRTEACSSSNSAAQEPVALAELKLDISQ